MFYDQSKASKFEAIAAMHKPAVELAAMSGDSILSGMAINSALNDLLAAYNSESVFTQAESSAAAPAPANNTNKADEDEKAKKAEAEAKAKAEKEAKAKAEAEAKAEKEAKAKAEAEAKAKAEEEERLKAEEEANAKAKEEDLPKPLINPSKAFSRRHEMDKIDTEKYKLASMEKELQDLKSRRHSNDKFQLSALEKQIDEKELEIRAQKMVIEDKRREYYENQFASKADEQSVAAKQEELKEIEKQLEELQAAMEAAVNNPKEYTETRIQFETLSSQKNEIVKFLNGERNLDLDEKTQAKVDSLTSQIEKIEESMQKSGHDVHDKISGTHPVLHSKQDKWIKLNKELNDILISSAKENENANAFQKAFEEKSPDAKSQAIYEEEIKLNNMQKKYSTLKSQYNDTSDVGEGPVMYPDELISLGKEIRQQKEKVARMRGND